VVGAERRNTGTSLLWIGRKKGETGRYSKNLFQWQEGQKKLTETDQFESS